MVCMVCFLLFAQGSPLSFASGSLWRCFVKKGVLKNFAEFTGKHLCWSLFSNNVAGLRPATLLRKRLQHRCFPVNFAKFWKAPLSQNTFRRLLLVVSELYWINHQDPRNNRDILMILGCILQKWINSHKFA